ncbi:MAG: Glu/Leu/Phe/Val dehydrogenase [Myxococcales bacterium]|nr:Glu/Leu/Phe/Val dehydrogenase [Myxococcales bacterium]
MLDRLQSEGLEQVVGVHDPASGLLGVIVIDDTTRGPAIGGCRLARYANGEAALDDAIRLARAMTLKCSLAGLPAGGGKGVFIEHDGITDRAAMLRAMGHYIDSLAGRFYTSGDLGIGPGDLAVVRETTRYVAVPDAQLDLAGAAADGLVAGMRCALRSVGLGADLKGRRVAVQGLGAMGGRLARRLVDAGATVFGADPNPAAAQAAAQAGVQLVDPAALFDLEVDIVSPCAVGGILDALAAERLRCKIVCGAANNQLASASVDARLHARGVAYVPDFAVNAGAVVLGASRFFESVPSGAEATARAAERIGEVVQRIFDEVHASGDPPGAVALRLAEAGLTRPRTAEHQWWPIR